MVVRILFEQGYKFVEAANGEEALRAVSSHADRLIDLLLSDVVMPQMGGIVLALVPSDLLRQRARAPDPLMRPHTITKSGNGLRWDYRPRR